MSRGQLSRVFDEMDVAQMIDLAVHRYREFASKDPPDDPRAFAAHASGCKAAISHLEFLLRFSRTMDKEHADNATDVGTGADIESLIAEAKASLPDS